MVLLVAIRCAPPTEHHATSDSPRLDFESNRSSVVSDGVRQDYRQANRTQRGSGQVLPTGVRRTSHEPPEGFLQTDGCQEFPPLIVPVLLRLGRARHLIGGGTLSALQPSTKYPVSPLPSDKLMMRFSAADRYTAPLPLHPMALGAP